MVGKMKPLVKKIIYRNKNGAALIISMIFVLLFSAFAVGLSSMCTTNVQIADNQRNANRARASAESGLEVIRLWMSNVSIPGDTLANQKFDLIATSLNLIALETSNVYTQSYSSHITIPSVNLSSADRSFTAVITPLPSASNDFT